MVPYEVWHDEHKGADDENEYWHGIYFIPQATQSLLLQDLKIIRDEYEIDYANEIKFAKQIKSSQGCRIISNHLTLFTHSLIVKENHTDNGLFKITGKEKYEKSYEPYLRLRGIYGCKYILLKIGDNHSSMSNYDLSYKERVETSFRFAFKSGLHYLFNQPIEIIRFHFDGNKHHEENIDLSRITKGEYREHVSFSEKVEIDDLQMIDRDTDSKLLMCLSDVIVGGLTAKIKDRADTQDALFPLEEIIDREISGKLNTNKNGRWYKSISISQMVIVNGQIDFPSIFTNFQQPTLF